MPKNLPGEPYAASNASKTAELFVKRKVYQAYAFYDLKNQKAFQLPPPVKDFWRTEDRFYGNIDPKYTPVQCSEQKLVEVEKGIKLMDFVALAYNEMKKEYEMANIEKRFPQDLPPLTTFKAVRGWEDPSVGHRQAMSFLTSIFLRKALKSEPLSAKLTSFEAFLPIFLDFVKDQGRSFPITFSSFIIGPMTNTLNSGLAFEIALFPHDSDEDKIKEFITHPYFEFYRQTALKYGFFIDMNAPWRLVADLSSDAMQKFMAVYIGSNVSPTKYFNVSTSALFLRDISRLQEIAVGTYNTFVSARPLIRTLYKKCGSLQVKTTYRFPVDAGTEFSTYPYLYWLRFYIQLKNMEKESPFAQARIDHIFNNSKNIVKSVDKVTALRYINRKFDEICIINGSLNYQLYKDFFTHLQPSQWPFTDFEDFFKRSVNAALYKTY